MNPHVYLVIVMLGYSPTSNIILAPTLVRILEVWLTLNLEFVAAEEKLICFMFQSRLQHCTAYGLPKMRTLLNIVLMLVATTLLL